MDVDEAAITGRQEVFDNDIDPVAELPELEVEDASVVLLNPVLLLVVRDHLQPTTSGILEADLA